MIRPADLRPPLPRHRFLKEEGPGADAVPLDVAIVGAGPAGLAAAIELARLAKRERESGGEHGDIEIGVLEKASALGEHSLSGAVVNRNAFAELFPDVPDDDLPFRGTVSRESVYFLTSGRALRVPVPPTMRNHGNRLASVCEIVRWMGERAEELGVNVFPGFPVDSLLTAGDGVIGVRTVPSGLSRDGHPGAGAMPAMDVSARITILAEGSRGPLTQSWLDWQRVGSSNPQIHALGIKELWEAPQPLDRVVHTMGWPLPRGAFGGSFMYPMGGNLVSLGLVVGLGAPQADLDVHDLLQRLKLHPLFRPRLEGGQLLEWGARTIPEGGHYSLPERRHGDGVMVVGDAAGYVEVSSLKGIHYAMHSGVLAARHAFRALKSGNVSEAALSGYTEAVNSSHIGGDLRKRRNMRLAFKGGLVSGAIRAGLMTLTGGAFPGWRIAVEDDADEERAPGEPTRALVPDGKLTFSKLDAVFHSGNQTRDDIPLHLTPGDALSGDGVEPASGRMLAALCPAGVYEYRDGQLLINAPNCIDCRATDVLGPRWAPREGGSGPAYRRM